MPNEFLLPDLLLLQQKKFKCLRFVSSDPVEVINKKYRVNPLMAKKELNFCVINYNFAFVSILA